MADSRYMCTLCPKSFIQKCHLNRHMLNHKDAKYPCNYCKKTFHRKDLKSKHEDKCFVRSGQKDDRTCNLCSKVLSKKSHLEEALSAGDEEALKLYQSSCNNDIEMDSVKLRPWQEEIIIYLE